MSVKNLRINLEGLEGGVRNQALFLADCLRGSGNLVGVSDKMLVKLPNSYMASFRGNCLVECVDIPLDDVKVNGWSIMGCEFKTNLTPVAVYEMDNGQVCELLEELLNDEECRLDYGTLPMGFEVVDVEEALEERKES